MRRHAHLVYATGNQAKLDEVAKHFATHDLKVESMRDLGVPDFDVPETGITLGENARIKVCEYIGELSGIARLNGHRVIVLSDDTGLEIKSLGGEPGIHVRRWKDRKTRMDDQEIIEHALTRMHGLRGREQRAAQFRTALAASILYEDGRTQDPQVFFGILPGYIREAPCLETQPKEGFPFARLFHVDEWGMVLGKAYDLSAEEKRSLLTHRERALNSALPYIRSRL